MRTAFISVPFKSESGSGLREYNGVAKFSPAGIVFEFESKLFGVIGSEVREVRVPLEEILDLRFRRGLFRFFARIELRLQHFAKLSVLPHESGRIKLKIKREDFELAEEAVARTLRRMGVGGGEEAFEDGDDPDALPPPTSVNELFDTEKLGKKDPKKTTRLEDEQDDRSRR